MRDLIERLRESAQNNDCEGCGDAADELATLKARLAQRETDLALTAEIATRNRDEAHAVSDVQEVLARVYAFKHFRDLSPDKGYTSPEVEDCFTLADEVERLKARLAECKDDLVVAMRERNDAEARLAAAERDAERWREFVKRSPLIAASCVAALDAARADGAGEGGV